jgi:PAS domain S-box-containing protein
MYLYFYFSLYKKDFMIDSQITADMCDMLEEAACYGESLPLENKFKIVFANESFHNYFPSFGDIIDIADIQNIFPEINNDGLYSLLSVIKREGNLKIYTSTLNKYLSIKTKVYDDHKFFCIIKDITYQKNAEIKLINEKLTLAKFQDKTKGLFTKKKHYKEDILKQMIELQQKNHELKELNNKLQSEKNRLSMSLKNAKQGVWEWDMKSNMITFDRYNNTDSPTQVIDSFKSSFKDWERLIHPDDQVLITSELKKCLNLYKDDFRAEYRFMEGNTWVWQSAEGYIKDRDENGSPINMIGTYRDISYQKRVETELKATNQNLKLTIEKIPNGILTFNKFNIINNWNQKASEITGHNEMEMIGNDLTFFWELITNLDVINISKTFNNQEVSIKTKSKEKKIVIINQGLMQDSSGMPSGGIITFEDITVLREYERKVLSAIIETEEKERQNISREIHDGLGSLLSTLKIYVNKYFTETLSFEKKKELNNLLNDLINESIQNVREISNFIRPSSLSKFGLISTIENFLNKISQSTNIKTIFLKEELEKRNIKFNTKVEVSLYRIVQELTNNTVKYANANNIIVNLFLSSDNLRLTLKYEDDGIGLPEPLTITQQEGNGLKNIMSRAKTMQADFKFTNLVQGGMQFIIELNLEENE